MPHVPSQSKQSARTIQMGTRHLICVYHKGRFQVAHYGQWDGYPSGQGITVLKFLIRPGNIERLKAGLEHTKIIVANTCEDFANLSEDDRQLLQSSASCSRDTGAKILDMVAQAGDADTAEGKIPIVLDLEFHKDGLFCEWVYVVDLDEEALEVYVGRFGLERRRLRPGSVRFGEDSGIGLIESFAFDSLPEDLQQLEVHDAEE